MWHRAPAAAQRRAGAPASGAAPAGWPGPMQKRRLRSLQGMMHADCYLCIQNNVVARIDSAYGRCACSKQNQQQILAGSGSSSSDGRCSWKLCDSTGWGTPQPTTSTAKARRRAASSGYSRRYSRELLSKEGTSRKGGAAASARTQDYLLT